VLTFERLRELLNYDPETGVFTRRVSRRGGGPAGSVAGLLSDRWRYNTVVIDNKRYAAHRLAWLYMTGEWPEHQIDHINGDALDNRFSNLRDVTGSLNQQNKRRPPRHNKTGLLGVCYAANGYQASIWVGGRSVYIGRYKTADEAHDAYVKAKREMHPGGML
jgi:hypothetical protein